MLASSRLITLAFITFMKTKLFIFFYFACFILSVNAQTISVPLGGNSWITTHSKNGNEAITQNGWQNWSEGATVFSTYVYLSKRGSLKLAAAFDVPNGWSEIQTTIDRVTKTSKISGSGRETKIGEWEIKRPGYVRIDIKGLRKSGAIFGNVKDLLLSGSAVDQNAAFVKNNEGNYFYWGRRGPSVHLWYDTSEVAGDIEYFYNEINVPEGNDVIGSYFMANGFGEGYFGFQVNSASERKVLFSVWSPFKTDDPNNIPSDKKIILVNKGADVVTGEFGNEGSGGQSFLRYNWKAGETYKFLLKGTPDRNNYTTYTAWFYTPELQNWRLIASFKRPSTNTYLKGLYSFLENYIPETGNVTRMAYYQNQWVRTKGGVWKSIKKANFTFDNTARKNYRRDYSGGVRDGKFYLRNCGFFSDSTPYQTKLSVAK